MKSIRNLILCLGVLFLVAPMLGAQELSKYRAFSLGMNVADVVKLSGQKLNDVKTTHLRPLLLQELPWWPPSSGIKSAQPESVERILFSFTNGELYMISVTYTRDATEGLTTADMVTAISSKYGPPTSVQSEIDPAMSALYSLKPTPLASWNNSQYSSDLIRASVSDHFVLNLYSKEVNTQVELATAESVKLDEQERPEKEAGEKKKQADDLEVTRQKNQKDFRP
jgi:hypothetical protein